MRGIGYNSSIARACTRHRVSRITRLRRKGSGHLKPQSAMGLRWDGNGMISTTSSSTLGSWEKSTNSNASENARFTACLTPMPNGRTVQRERCRKKGRSDEGEKDRLTLISPLAILRFLSPSFSLQLAWLVNDLKSKPATRSFYFFRLL